MYVSDFGVGFLCPLKSRLFLSLTGEQLHPETQTFPPSSTTGDDKFKPRVEGRGWGCFTDAPGDPLLYKQVVYEEVSQKCAMALRGGKGRDGANSANGPRGDRSLLHIPHLL